MSTLSVPIGEVADFNPSGPKASALEGSEIAFVPMASVGEDGTMRVDEHRDGGGITNGYSYFQNGDVVVAKITPCYENNKIAVVRIDRAHGFGSTEFHVLRPRPQRLDARYLSYFLRQDTVRAIGQKRMTGSAGQRRVPKQFLEQLEIPLPPVDEQRRIAAILDQADALRRKRREALDLLKQTKAALFDEIFGDPVTNPKGWAKKKAQEICERITVGIVVKPASYYKESGIPAIRGTNIKGSGIDLSDVVFFSEEDNLTRLKKTRVWEGDLVIVRSGRPGLSAIVPKELNGANSIDVLIASPTKSQIQPKFFRDFLNSQGGKRIVLSEARGQIQQHFNVRSLSEAFIYVPPMDVQNRYVSGLSGIETLEARASISLDQLDALFSSLQHRAFSGEL